MIGWMGFDPVNNMTLIELVWLLAALTGTAVSSGNLYRAYVNRRIARADENALREQRLIVADGYVFRGRVRTAIFLWWTFIGALYGFFDPPEAPRLAGLLGLLATAYGWAVIEIQEHAEQRALDALIRKAAEVIAEQAHQREVVAPLRQTVENTERIATNTEELLNRGDRGNRRRRGDD